MLINDLGNGGAEKVVSKIVNRKTNQLILIQIWPKQFNEITCDKTFFLLEKKGFILLDLLKASLTLFNLVKQEKITTINSHLFWANYLNIVVSIFTKHTSVSTHCVSFISKFKNKNIVGFFHRSICRLLLHRSDRHIYKSYDMKKEYESLFNLNNGCVIYNPMDIENTIELSSECVDFNFKPEKKYLLCVGRFHPTKRQCNLIKVLTYLPDEYEIIFLGVGETMAKCKSLSAELNLSSRTHFLGQCSNPYPFYNNADVYISASDSEGFPNALVEAIVLKCYPIHFDCPTGPKEILSLSYKYQPIQEFSHFNLYGLGVLLKNKSPQNIASSIQYKFSSEAKISESQRTEFLSLVDSEHIFDIYNDTLIKARDKL